MPNGRNPVPFNHYEFVNNSGQPARVKIQIYGVPLAPDTSHIDVQSNAPPFPTLPVKYVDVAGFEYEVFVGGNAVGSGREFRQQADTWMSACVVTLAANGTTVTHAFTPAP